ncbi:MAG: alpha-amylase family glycosyl hydrolase [Spirochaetia bacterium]|jgi:glycosidase
MDIVLEHTLGALRSASIYQIFVRNYTSEGTLQAAAARLPEPAELGFDYVYLTPVHPIGQLRRKGSLGSPYAIADYRAVDPLLGGEAGLRAFIDEAHRLGLGVIMDVVYNHTSPDAALAREHPEWYWKGPDGKPGPRIADWSDVADLDYSQKGLWDYQIETLERWARFGADGFRCDVASLVPVEFWVEARRRLASIKPVLWLAESVHKEFVTECRRHGHYAASDPELHAAFDITYDYDGRSELEAAWKGEKSLGYYLKHLEVQEALYPERAVKLRFLENHDQERAASRFGRGSRLRNWTLLSMLLPGAYMAYMGEEHAMERRIGLFDLEPMLPEEGDPSFASFFAKALSLSKRIKTEAPLFDARLLGEGVVLAERLGEGARYVAVLNLDGRSGSLAVPEGCSLEGKVLMGTRPERIGRSIMLRPEGVVIARPTR